jgi:DNA gyrase subunit A
VMLISTGGTMIKMPAEGIKRSGRATQGVIVMRLREGELVSSLAPVLESENGDDADPPVASLEGGFQAEAEPVEELAGAPDDEDEPSEAESADDEPDDE